MLSKEQLKAIELVGTGTSSISEAMKIVDRDRSTYYNWLKNPEFVAELEKCQQETKSQAVKLFDNKLPLAIKELWEICLSSTDTRVKAQSLQYWIDRSLGRIKASSDDDNNIDDDNTNVKSMLQEVKLEIKEEQHEENKPPSEVREKKTA